MKNKKIKLIYKTNIIKRILECAMLGCSSEIGQTLPGEGEGDFEKVKSEVQQLLTTLETANKVTIKLK